jgi:glycosyltransferase involved in cell wall biosynthesis
VNAAISAVVCTFNRAQYLRKAIRSLLDQTLPSEDYEIIVVDNGSTDGTAEMVRDEFPCVSNLNYIREPVLGLSQARNKGWRCATGDYVAYLDDDAVASPSWLENILRVFETVRPMPGCVGGKVELIWEASRPKWLSEEMVGYLTKVDLAKTPVIVNDTQWLAGANMAFPRGRLEELSGFDLGLGRKSNKLLSMEEIQVQRKLQNKGYNCFYDPEVSVKHHVPPSRLTQKWFLRRAYWQGVSNALVEIQRKVLSALERTRIGVSVARRVFLSRRQMANLLMPTNDAERFALKCSALSRVGYAMAFWGIAK